MTIVFAFSDLLFYFCLVAEKCRDRKEIGTFNCDLLLFHRMMKRIGFFLKKKKKKLAMVGYRQPTEFS